MSGTTWLRYAGFTLIELIISIAILMVLAGIAYPLYAGYIDQARNDSAIADIQTISATIAGYHADTNSYPQALSEVGYGTYADPWGHPYQYLNIETAHGKGQMRKDHFLVPINSDFDLYSMGKDGRSVPPLTAKDSRDDIIRANDGAYVGPASAY